MSIYQKNASIIIARDPGKVHISDCLKKYNTITISHIYTLSIRSEMNTKAMTTSGKHPWSPGLRINAFSLKR